jgi:hypothetical protein
MLGLSAATVDVIKERILREHHGDALDAQEELEQQIETASKTVEAAIEGLAHMTGTFDLGKFAELASPHVRGAFYLKKIKDENGAEVVQVFKHKNPADKFGYGWTAAQPDEIDNGSFYNNHAEWLAANGGQTVVP